MLSVCPTASSSADAAHRYAGTAAKAKPVAPNRWYPQAKKTKMREFDALAAASARAVEAKLRPIDEVVEFVRARMPEGYAATRAELDEFAALLRDAVAKRRPVFEAASTYPYDALVRFLLTSFPTHELWVEALMEQLSMRVAEAELGFQAHGHGVGGAGSAAAGAVGASGTGGFGERVAAMGAAEEREERDADAVRISVIMSRGAAGERAPSL